MYTLCCKISGDNITRHNRVSNLLNVFCEEGTLSPVMEKLNWGSWVMRTTQTVARAMSPSQCGPRARTLPSTSPPFTRSPSPTSVLLTVRRVR